MADLPGHIARDFTLPSAAGPFLADTFPRIAICLRLIQSLLWLWLCSFWTVSWVRSSLIFPYDKGPKSLSIWQCRIDFFCPKWNQVLLQQFFSTESRYFPTYATSKDYNSISYRFWLRSESINFDFNSLSFGCLRYLLSVVRKDD